MAHFQVNRQQPEFNAAATDYSKDFVGDNAHFLNEIARNFCEWVVYPKAMKAGQKAIELAKATGQDYQTTQDLLDKLKQPRLRRHWPAIILLAKVNSSNC